MRSAAVVAAAVLGCAPATESTMQQVNDECAACHVTEWAQWQNPSSHNHLFVCTDCHTTSTAVAGAGHATSPLCSTCHSETAHPAGAACTTCHDPHGSPNAFLIVPVLTRPAGGNADILVTAPEGASLDGLVRAGVDDGVAGTGLCETCHDSTTYYNAFGTGAPHPTEWCAECHDHQAGFAADAGN